MSKIKHEQARVAFEKYSWLSGKLANWVGRDWSELEEEYNFLIVTIYYTFVNEDIIESYINQQEKQEKLLELYKELIIELDLELEEFKRFGDKAKNPALDKLRIKNETFVFEGNASSLFKQIKELEDD